MPTFTDPELSVLKRFYAREPARTIRADTGINPWPLVARHRNLPSAEHAAVKAQLIFDDIELSILRMYRFMGYELEEIELAHPDSDVPRMLAHYAELDAADHATVLEQAATLKLIDVGAPPPDHPIFTRGVEGFTVRRR